MNEPGRTDATFHVEVTEHPAYVERGKSSLMLEMRFPGPSLDMASIFAVIEGRNRGVNVKLADIEAAQRWLGGA